MGVDPGTFGTQEQVRLQLKSINMREEIETTPGLCHTGRIFASDDPGAIGWEILDTHLEEDGFVGLRALSPTQADSVRAWAKPRADIHEWAVMLAGAEELRVATVPIMRRTLAEGYRDVNVEEMGTDRRLAQMQALIADSGIAPLARASLRGEVFPSVCVGISGLDGSLVAVANAALHFNRYSPWHDTAWIGLVAVVPECRGLGFGVRVSAAAALAAVQNLGAARAMAFVTDNNAPSRAMLMRIGLQPTDLRTIAVGGQFTRGLDT